MRVLVTGGAGFIGSHLCDRLVQDGHDVVCMDNLSTSSKRNLHRLVDHPRFEFVRHDVCDPFHVECDRIYHLACPASPVQYQRNPVRTIKTATIGTLNALELARNTGARMLITSTSEIYGDPLVHPQRESYLGNVNTLGPRACYDEGKRCAEALAASWAQQYRTDVRIARLFNTYGPRMAPDDGRLIPNLICQAMDGKPLTVYGDGKQTRSFCYIEDTIHGILGLMNLEQVFGPGSRTDNGGSQFTVADLVMNIGNPDERTILDVAKAVIEVSGLDLSVEHRGRPTDDPMQRCPDISRIERLVGWSPTVPFGTGMRATWDWFVGVDEPGRILA